MTTLRLGNGIVTICTENIERQAEEEGTFPPKQLIMGGGGAGTMDNSDGVGVSPRSTVMAGVVLPSHV